MPERATPAKLPEPAAFRDLSDYARPLAVRLAHRLAGTRVRAPHVTLVWAVIGLAGAGAYAAGGYGAALAGALLLQAKNVLDAVDGSLARLQRRPSRIGRFLDTLCDALVAAALYAGLGVSVARVRPPAYAAALAGAALLLGLLQGSVFNYYYVRYRARRGGDATSRVEERYTAEDAARYAGRPLAAALLRVLLLAYRAVYGWQDALVRRLDRWAAGRGAAAEAAESVRDDPTFMAAVSVLGPGVQILLLDACTVAGWRRPEAALELFLAVVALLGSVYAGALLVGLRWAAQRRGRRGSQRAPAAGGVG